jgi:hypothetical protein
MRRYGRSSASSCRRRTAVKAWRALLTAAVAWARKRGVTLLEAYPVDREGRPRDDAMWFGAKSMFDDAGFSEVARRKPHRPVVRLRLQRTAGAQP